MVDKKQIDAFRDRIVTEFQPEKIILFGSYAYGKPNKDSDVDILVVLPFEGKSAHKATEIIMAVGHPGFPVDLLARTPEKVKERISMGDFFMKEIFKQGESIYEADYA
ncbi:MAG: nucleotidyltransferase domain-containing protein [Chloroflexota bacterium]|nr:nucleotidyltransferase domain-containing protein [Chloroflexota bacterium]